MLFCQNLVVAIALLGLIHPAGAQGEDKNKQPNTFEKQVYTANALATSGSLAGKNTQITIYVNSVTPDDEVRELADTLQLRGPDGLETALDKTKERGRFAVVGSTGNDISVVRIHPASNGGHRIVMVTNRTIGFYELRNNPRSRDYKFGIIELRVDADGKGDGTIYAASKLSFNKNKELQIEHYGISPVKVVNLRLSK
jgi:hypothetical protein